MDKKNDTSADMNDSYARTVELVEQYEKEATDNESKADQLEAEADRLRDVAKEKRNLAKEEQKHADEISNPKRKASDKSDK